MHYENYTHESFPPRSAILGDQEGSLSALPDGPPSSDDLDLAAFYEAKGFIFPTFEEKCQAAEYTVNQEALNTWNTAYGPAHQKSWRLPKEARIASQGGSGGLPGSHPLQWTDGEYYAITAESATAYQQAYGGLHGPADIHTVHPDLELHWRGVQSVDTGGAERLGLCH